MEFFYGNIFVIYRIIWIGPSTIWNGLSSVSQQLITIAIDYISILNNSSSSSIPTYLKSPSITYDSTVNATICIALYLDQYNWYAQKEELLLSTCLSLYGNISHTLLLIFQPSDCGIFESTSYLKNNVPFDNTISTVIGNNGRKRNTSNPAPPKKNNNINSQTHIRGTLSLSSLVSSILPKTQLEQIMSTITTEDKSVTSLIQYDPYLVSPNYINRTSLSPPLFHKVQNTRMIIEESLIDTVIDITSIMDILKTIPPSVLASLNNTNSNGISTTTSSTSFSLSSSSSSSGTTQFLSWKSTLSSSTSSSSASWNPLTIIQQKALDELTKLLNINFYDVLRLSPGHFTEILKRIEGLSLAGFTETLPTSPLVSILSNKKHTSTINKHSICISYAPCNVYQCIYSNSLDTINNLYKQYNLSLFLNLPSEKYLFYPGPWNKQSDQGTIQISIPYRPLSSSLTSNHTHHTSSISSTKNETTLLNSTIELNPWFPSGLFMNPPTNTTTSTDISSTSPSNITNLKISTIDDNNNNNNNNNIFFNRGVLNWHYQRAQWRYRPLGYTYPLRAKHPCSLKSGGPMNEELYEQLLSLLYDTNSGSYPLPGGNMGLGDILDICQDVWDDGKKHSSSDDDW